MTQRRNKPATTTKAKCPDCGRQALKVRGRTTRSLDGKRKAGRIAWVLQCVCKDLEYLGYRDTVKQAYKRNQHSA